MLVWKNWSSILEKTAAVLLFLIIAGLLKAESGKEAVVPGIPTAPLRGKRILPPAKEASEYSRLCRTQDITGFWRVVKWTPYFYIPAKDWKKPAFMNFQWYIFTADGKIKSLSAPKEFKINEVKEKLGKVDTPLRFTFERKGILKVTSTKKKEVNELWRCAVVTKDVSNKQYGIDLKKGDVLQSLLGKENKILYVRQMRKITDKVGQK